ncbi:MAG: hypothetical protein QOE11_3535, partial [Solirubrobacteraceae bacterium]|nr:hypothetical protein [Solirubrobacteraceae bacterium]
MTTELDSDTQAVARARLLHTERVDELGDLHDDSVEAAGALALALVRAGRAAEGVELVRGLAGRATE